MQTVGDFKTLCESVIKDSAPAEYSHMTRSYTVLLYSIMYLVSERKLRLDDPIEDWNKYWAAFDLSDHYKVAEAYLRRTGQAPLNYTDEKFREVKR